MAAVQVEKRRPRANSRRPDFYRVLLSHRANLVLCGFMGTGKTSLARTLARLYQMPWLDTDDLISEAAGVPTGQALRERGEPAFRELEREVVRDAAGRVSTVIATGGGVPLDERNLQCLGQSGVLFLLEASPASLARRLAEDGDRPLLVGTTPDQLAAQLSGRAEAYARISERIQTDGRTVEDLAREVYARYLRQARLRT